MSAAVKHASVGGHTDAVLCCEVLSPKKILLSGGEDGLICLADLTTQSSLGQVHQQLGEAVAAVCCSPCDEHTVYAAAGDHVLTLDLRKGLSNAALVSAVRVNQDEINSLAVSSTNGGWLAAGDDSGQVEVISLQSLVLPASSTEQGSSRQLASAALRPAYKTLRRGHSNICAAVAFRPHRPWELLSGGLDSCVVRWDFSRLRPLQSWNLSMEAAASSGQVFNPPLVHSLAVPQSDDRSLSRLMAVARGDGCVAVYDADSKPTVPGNNSSSSRKGSGSKASRQKERGSSSNAAQPAQQQAAPGRLCLLGAEQGGHTAAVNCVSFLHGSQWQRLLSGSNDRRLLLWDWRRAAEAAFAAAEAEESAAATIGSSPSTEGAAQHTAAAEVSQQQEAAEALVAQVQHGRKVNWACSFEPVGGVNVAVADTSCRLTLLSLS